MPTTRISFINAGKECKELHSFFYERSFRFANILCVMYIRLSKNFYKITNHHETFFSKAYFVVFFAEVELAKSGLL